MESVIEGPISGPPWSLIHFDVHCARCGHDLRGQTEPVCPACKLEFSWEQAAPLEHLTCSKCNYHLYGIADSRCPECGTSVDWNEALLRYRRREKPLFEYRWRDRPIRSFFRTWLLALRPSRLWREIDIHDPPQPKPLVLWAVVLMVVTFISFPLGVTLGFSIRRIVSFITAGPSFWTRWQVEWLVRELWQIFQTWTPRSSLYLNSVFVLVWLALSFLSLLVFQQSMRLCKVKTAHIFRIFVYSFTSTLPFFAFFFCFVEASVRSRAVGQLYWFDYVPFLHLLRRPSGWVALTYLILVIWSLRKGYRRYVRMPHSLAVVISSQAIALLATISVPSAIATLLGWNS